MNLVMAFIRLRLPLMRCFLGEISLPLSSFLGCRVVYSQSAYLSLVMLNALGFQDENPNQSLRGLSESFPQNRTLQN